MATFPFELVSPERLLFSEQVDEVVAPGAEGEFTVLSGHAPFITPLRPGVVTVKASGKTSRLYIRGGFADVNPAGLTILADAALPFEDLDQARLEAEVALAERGLEQAVDEEAKRRAQEQIDRITEILHAIDGEPKTSH